MAGMLRRLHALQQGPAAERDEGAQQSPEELRREAVALEVLPRAQLEAVFALVDTTSASAISRRQCRDALHDLGVPQRSHGRAEHDGADDARTMSRDDFVAAAYASSTRGRAAGC
jgi:hypothetical protein